MNEFRLKVSIAVSVICLMLAFFRPFDIAADNRLADASTSNRQTSFNIYDSGQDKILNVSDKDFLISALACEMPLSYETEALKAQVVAVYSVYSLKRAENRRKSENVDFTCNSVKWLIYTTTEEMQARWGSSYESNYKKLTDIVESVYGEYLSYCNDYAMTTYYAISSGQTESSEDIWGGALPYLVSVDSSWDRNNARCVSQVTIEHTDFKTLISNELKNCVWDNNFKSWIGTVERTNSGSVTDIEIASVNFTGGDIRRIFSLKSANFEIDITAEEVCITVYGYGHGVGMSQEGANYMAKQGYTYKEILEWYYPTTSLSSVE